MRTDLINQNFFSLGLHDHEALSTVDFRRSPWFKNLFIAPAAGDGVTLAIPTIEHLTVIKLNPKIIRFNETVLKLFLFSNQENPFEFNYHLEHADGFWIQPGIETAEIISIVNFTPVPIYQNVFYYENPYSQATKLAYIVKNKAFTLAIPTKFIKPK